MHLILCCGNTVLRERWAAALKPVYALYQVNGLQELRIFVRQHIPIDFLLIHRPLVDRDSIGYIREKLPACKLFILSDRPDEPEGLELVRLGVAGYANSYTAAERLREAVRAVTSGSVWINQQLMQRLIRDMTPGQPPAKDSSPTGQALAGLSNREYQIASLIADGLSNQEIAEELKITERTVKAHLSAIYAKSPARNRLALALAMKQRQTA